MKPSTIVLIDYENIKASLDCSQMPKSMLFYIFGGRNFTLPFEMLQQTSLYPDRLRWIKVEGGGPNNVDFHLSYFLGKLHMLYNTKVSFYVLSKDTGFDNLVSYINVEGRHCERITDLNDLKKKKYRLPKPLALIPTKASSLLALAPRTKKTSTTTRKKTIKISSEEIEVITELAGKIKAVFEKRNGNPKSLSKLKNTIQAIIKNENKEIDADKIIEYLSKEMFLSLDGQKVEYKDKSLSQ